MKATLIKELEYIENYHMNGRDNYFIRSRMLWMVGEFNEEKSIDNIKYLNFFGDGSNKPVRLYICSEGGDTDLGFAIIDAMESLKQNGTPIHTVCVGRCSSMASLILAAGTKGKRYSYPSARIMIHKPFYEETPDGSIKGIEIYKNELEISINSYIDALVNFTGKEKREINKALKHDNFMSAKEAIDFGLIDKITTHPTAYK